MCIKINKIGKKEVGIWWVQKRFPRYGVPIWSLWPNIRFLPLTVTEKMRRKISWTDGRTDGQMDRGKTVDPPTPLGSGGIIKFSIHIQENNLKNIYIKRPHTWCLYHFFDKSCYIFIVLCKLIFLAPKTITLQLTE